MLPLYLERFFSHFNSSLFVFLNEKRFYHQIAFFYKNRRLRFFILFLLKLELLKAVLLIAQSMLIYKGMLYTIQYIPWTKVLGTVQ